LIAVSVYTGITILLWCNSTKQIAISRDTEQRQLRAYISVANGHIELTRGQNGGGKIIAFVEIKNSGQTPAYEVKSWFKPPQILDGTALPFDSPTPIKDRETSNIIGSQVSNNITYAMQITKDELTALDGGTKKVFFWGGADYKDVFRKEDRFLYFRMISGNEGSGPGWSGWFLSPHRLGSDAN
jgi:hypothetical protein